MFFFKKFNPKKKKKKSWRFSILLSICSKPKKFKLGFIGNQGSSLLFSLEQREKVLIRFDSEYGELVPNRKIKKNLKKEKKLKHI